MTRRRTRHCIRLGGGFDRQAPAVPSGVLAASQGVVSGAQGHNPAGSTAAPTSSGTPSAQTAPPAGFGRGGFGVGTGLGCGSGIDHRHEWCRAIQIPSEGIVPSDDHPAADGAPWLDSSPGIALSGRERERSNARSGEDIHGGFGQAVGRHPVRRAPKPRHLGRIGRRGGHGHPNVFPAQGVSRSREAPNTRFAPSTTFSARTRYPALRM